MKGATCASVCVMAWQCTKTSIGRTSHNREKERGGKQQRKAQLQTDALAGIEEDDVARWRTEVDTVCACHKQTASTPHTLTSHPTSVHALKAATIALAAREREPIEPT